MPFDVGTGAWRNGRFLTALRQSRTGGIGARRRTVSVGESREMRAGPDPNSVDLFGFGGDQATVGSAAVRMAGEGA